MSEAIVLREAFEYPFSRLDPTGAHIDPPAVAIYETAVAKGPDWRAHPLLARDWSTANGGLSWRIHLRPGLHFHSGASCDAAAVAAACTYLRDNCFEHRQLWYWDPVEAVVVEDPLTLRFDVHHPYSRLPSLLWGGHTAVFNDALRRAEPERFGYALADGTGPYRLASWSPERVTAQRWPDYRPPSVGFLGGRMPLVERIEWLAITDEHERLDALERGDVDCLHEPPFSEVARLRVDPRYVLTSHPQASTFYLALDWRRTELGFDNAAVRRAVSLALDRTGLVNAALAGLGTPTRGPVPPGDEFYDATVDESLAPDTVGAAQLLDASGWTREGGGVRSSAQGELRFACLAQDTPTFRRLVEELGRQLEFIGIALEPHFAQPFAAFYRECASGRYPATLSKWLWQDAVEAVIGFSSTSTAPMPNWQHASCPALDAAYDAYLRADSRDELLAAAKRAQREFVLALPYIPLATPLDVFVSSQRVRGWAPYRANLYPYYQGVELARG